MVHVRVAWKIQNDLMKFIGWPSKVGCVLLNTHELMMGSLIHTVMVIYHYTEILINDWMHSQERASQEFRDLTAKTMSDQKIKIKCWPPAVNGDRLCRLVTNNTDGN